MINFCSRSCMRPCSLTSFIRINASFNSPTNRSSETCLSMKGITLHGLLHINDRYQIQIEKDSEGVRRFQAVTGVIIDEFLKNDMKAFRMLQDTCQLFPLAREKRKKLAFAEFGYRDILLMENVSHMPTAADLTPMVSTTLFQNNSEMFYLRGTRRLGSIRFVPGIHCESPDKKDKHQFRESFQLRTHEWPKKKAEPTKAVSTKEKPKSAGAEKLPITSSLGERSQSRSPTATLTQLFVKCPAYCGQTVALDRMKLASDGGNKTVWNCPTCRKIKQKQVRIAWSNIVCVKCTHKNGRECCILACTSSCLTKQTLETKKRRKTATSSTAGEVTHGTQASNTKDSANPSPAERAVKEHW